MQIEQRRVEKSIGWPGDVLLLILPIILEFRVNVPAWNLHVIYTGTRTYRDRKHNFSNYNWWWCSWQGLKSCSCIYSEYIEWWKGSKMRKSYMYTRVRVFWNTHPPSTASPFGRINLERSQATASKHRLPHSVQVRVRVGWSASGATAKIPLHK